MHKRYFLLLAALVALPLLSFGGTTGKVKGKITDQKSGEPLIGATVVVVGTSLGAAANVDGEYGASYVWSAPGAASGPTSAMARFSP